VRVYDDNSLSIGHTPLVKLRRVTDGARATVLAKIEGRNPAYSVKCRIGASMVWDAEKRGVLETGQALDRADQRQHRYRAGVRGCGARLSDHPDHASTMSVERRKVLRVLGAKLVLTEGAGGMAGAIAKAEEIRASDPARYVLLQQFSNPANPAIHFETTGPEIWDDTDGTIDVLVSGIRTGEPSPAWPLHQTG